MPTIKTDGKGATPNWSGFSDDDDGRTIVPLNMAEPILVLKHKDNRDALGFAPHGAGRNVGRKAFLRENEPRLPTGIDARFYCGKPDLSELPEAYKNAASVRSQITKCGLGEVIDVPARFDHGRQLGSRCAMAEEGQMRVCVSSIHGDAVRLEGAPNPTDSRVLSAVDTFRWRMSLVAWA